jgi:hypothetical protein
MEQDNLWRTSDLYPAGSTPANAQNVFILPTDRKQINPTTAQIWPRGSYATMEDPSGTFCGPVSATPVKNYCCPSRHPPGNGDGRGNAWQDYSFVVPGPVPLGLDSNGQPTDWSEGHAFGADDMDKRAAISSMMHPNTFAAITDGLSNTIMISEKFMQPQDYNRAGWRDDDCPMGTREDDNVCTTSQEIVNRGANPAHDQNGIPMASNNWGQYTVGAAHPAGVNALFGDGAVHNVKYGIDPQIFNALGNIQDGTSLPSQSNDW